MSHRIIQAGKGPRRSLIQLATQSRIGSEVSSGCSGSDPIGSWKPPRLKAAQPPWAACSTAGLPWLKENSPVFSGTSPVSVHVCCLSPCWHGLLWPCLRAKFTISTGGSVESPESPFLPPDEQASASPNRMPALLLQSQPSWQFSTELAAFTMPSSTAQETSNQTQPPR